MDTSQKNETLALCADLLACRVIEFSDVKEGGNNCIWKLVTDRGDIYSVKRYVGDLQNLSYERIDREYQGLSFLKENEFENIPSPIAINREQRIAIYSWVEGRLLTEHDDNSLCNMANFAKNLMNFRRHENPKFILEAKENCLDGHDYIDQVDFRLKNLSENSDVLSDELSSLLKDMKDLYEVIKEKHSNAFIKLAQKYHVLNPSDFGLHNALLASDNRLRFVDFEYFGWDDPVRLIVDAIQHPAVPMEEESVFLFLNRSTDNLRKYDLNFEFRMKAVYPLLSLRWACIMLNEFLPVCWERRQLAGEKRLRDDVLATQMAKAHQHIEKHQMIYRNL